MKYLKEYESSKKDTPNFTEGDNVICIDNEDSVLTKNMIYLVKKIFKNKNGYYVCKVNSKLGGIGERLGTFSCNRFISEFENDTKKYNL
jgi:ribosomal protein S19